MIVSGYHASHKAAFFLFSLALKCNHSETIRNEYFIAEMYSFLVTTKALVALTHLPTASKMLRYIRSPMCSLDTSRNEALKAPQSPLSSISSQNWEGGID